MQMEHFPPIMFAGLIVFLLFAITVVNYIDRAALSYAIPMIQRDLGLSPEATGAILKQATNNRDSLSAVNLDEEAANLIKFEQYYNASAQIIQVARSLFDTLITSFR